MRDKILKALKQFDNNVFYGAVTEKDFQKLSSADCIIFASSDYHLKDAKSKDLIAEYYVFIVRENYICENLIVEIINAMEAIPGLRLTNQPNNFEYMPKGKTDIMLETIRLQFSKTIKRY